MIEISKRISKKIKVITFFCAILVVFIHSYNLKVYSINSKSIGFAKFTYIIEAFISQGVARVAVPLFFVISAFLFFYNIPKDHVSFNWFVKKYRKRFKSLVIPFLIWNTISYFIYLIPYFVVSMKPILIGSIKEITFLDFLNGVFLFKYNMIFWFIFNLIILIALSPIIYLVLKNKIRGRVVTIFILMLWLFRTKNGNAILDSRFRLDALCFFTIGTYIALNGERIFKKILDKKYALLLVLFWVSLLTINIISPTKFIYKFGIFIGVIALWYGFDLIINNVPIKKYMNHTFMIYALHTVILKITTNLIINIQGKDTNFALLNYFISPILTLIIIYVVSNILKRYFPTLYGTINGSREKLLKQ